MGLYDNIICETEVVHFTFTSHLLTNESCVFLFDFYLIYHMLYLHFFNDGWMDNIFNLGQLAAIQLH